MASEEGAESSDALVGVILNERYEIRRHLGAGGMGVVYEAHHRLIDKRVVVKVLRSAFASDATMVERFQREAKAATAIDHPHIVDVTDFGVLADGSPFIVMELLEGRSLGEELEALEVLPIARAAEIIRQVCDALDAAHAKGIVHRDMKPDNVFLVDRPRGGDFVKVLDFGISRVLTAEPEARLTRTGAAMGTPAYMAPEQAQGLPSVDHRADVYSVGVMLYEMLGGDLPFHGETLAALLLKVMMADPRPLTELRGDVPPALAAVVEAAMAKEANERPSAAELHDALEPFIGMNEAPVRIAGASGSGLQPETVVRPGVTERQGAHDPGADPMTAPTLVRGADVVVAPTPGELLETRASATSARVAEREAVNVGAATPPISRRSSRPPRELGERDVPNETRAEIEALDARPSPWRPMVGALVLGLVATAGVAVWFVESRDPPTPSAAIEPTLPTAAEVRVRVRVTPADATITLDGTEFPNPMDVARPRSLEPTRLAIARDGYRSIERTIVLDQDRTYDYELAAEAPAPTAIPEPETPGGEALPRPRRGRSQGRESEETGEPAESTETTDPGNEGEYAGRRGQIREDF